jgi:hypothetical protein
VKRTAAVKTRACEEGGRVRLKSMRFTMSSSSSGLQTDMDKMDKSSSVADDVGLDVSGGGCGRLARSK